MRTTPEDLLRQAINLHKLEREREKMNQQFVNNSSQDERKAVLKNDQAQTYFERAQETIGEELGGRFKGMTKTAVVGVPQYPRQPSNSPFAGDPCGVEPPLGYDINAMPTVGTPAEVATSIGAELQKAIEAGSKVERAADVVPSHEPIKRRV